MVKCPSCDCKGSDRDGINLLEGESGRDVLREAWPIAPKLVGYKFARIFGRKPPPPINLTVSVTKGR